MSFNSGSGYENCIDQSEASANLEVLIASFAGAGEGADVVGAGRVGAAVGQGVQRESEAILVYGLIYIQKCLHYNGCYLGSEHSLMSTHFLAVPWPTHSWPSLQSWSASHPRVS